MRDREDPNRATNSDRVDDPIREPRHDRRTRGEAEEERERERAFDDRLQCAFDGGGKTNTAPRIRALVVVGHFDPFVQRFGCELELHRARCAFSKAR